jgi:hypothetical protein
MARAGLPDGSRRKLIEFDAETWQALHGLARDRMSTLQELADEAFADLLRKHHRPVTLKEALSASAGELSAAERKGARPAKSGKTGNARRPDRNN